MEPTAGKPGFLRNLLLRLLFFGVFIIGARFAYLIAIAGESCNVGDFCFFSLPETLSLVIAGTGPLAVESASGIAGGVSSKPELYTSKDWINAVHFYSSVFQDLIAGGYLSPESNSLCVDTPTGSDVFALREIGVRNAIGISKKAAKPLVKSSTSGRIPFGDGTFDFLFSGEGSFGKSAKPAEFAAEIGRTLKPGGFAVFHFTNPKDTYSFNSFLDLFNCFRVVKLHGLEGFDSSIPYIHETVLKKESGDDFGAGKFDGDYSNGKCYVPGYKLDLVKNAEPLIAKEPLKPWITLKSNVKNIKYLPSMVDISFKNRYLYVDVGARSYGSSIGSWFRKQYPKQNKTFHVYAIEADKTFHKEYGLKKGLTLVPYAAWVKNETLTFEIHRDPGEQVEVKGRGMGRIRPLKSSGEVKFDGEVETIRGFDFANWLKKTVSKNDFVVMKMDVEGTEFDLIPRLFETGAICLIDEIFLECHYNRWQRCCPGQRSSKYEKTYDQCLDLFNSLRQSGVLVHQWW